MDKQTDGSKAIHALLYVIDALLGGDTAFDGAPDDNHQHRLLDGISRQRLEGIKARLEVHTTGDAGVLAGEHYDHRATDGGGR